MSDTATREERLDALDRFAELKSNVSQGQLVPAAQYAPPADQQHGAIALAVKRDESLVLQRIKSLAAAAGADWYYRWPVKNRKENRVDFVEGPSIKCANDLARLYGNCDVDVRVQDAGSHWVFHGRFIDLETGFSLTRPYNMRKTGATMGDDPDRRMDIAFQIGASKAIRNVVTNALQTFADFAVTEAKSALVDKIGVDIERWRRVAVERVAARVELPRVEAVVGRPSKDWLAPDIAKVIAMMTAVVEGMASLDETFPPLKPSAPADQALDKFASEPPSSTSATEADAGGPAQHGAPASAPASSDKRQEAVQKILALATDAKLNRQERLELLDGAKPHWDDQVGSAFSTRLFTAATQVVNGELSIDDARRFMEAQT